MRVAITGATGMIGLSLVNAVLDNGDEVIAIVDPNSKRTNNLPTSSRLVVIGCDIGDYKSLLNANRCDIFFHLAWKATAGVDRDNVHLQCENVMHTLDAVDLAHSWGATAFIGAGSQAEYGPCDEKLNSSTPVNPQSGYGIAKYSAGKFSKLACDRLQIRFCWARILSVYGKYDADHTLISYVISSLLKSVPPQLTKCEQQWDYIYSDDAAAALLAIGTRGKNGKTYCIGSGSCRTLREYVTCIRDHIDPSFSIDFGIRPYYPHQPMYLCADIKELTDDTGFMPKYSFDDGIALTITDVRNRISREQIFVQILF
jgi:UDP-glucose 4-epimerase